MDSTANSLRSIPDPARERWPRLSAAVEWAVGVDSVSATIALTNDGDSSAPHVVGAIDATPADAVAPSGPIEFGTLDPGHTATRSVTVDAAGIGAKAAVFTFDARSDAAGCTAPRVEWLWLPRHLHDEAAYRARVTLVHETAFALLRELSGDAETRSELLELPGSRYGFFSEDLSAGAGAYVGSVEYQNPFTLHGDALAVNRDVTQVRDHDVFMRHAEMMAYWYVPHELVHVFRGRAEPGWNEEYIANTIQPYLTAAVLERIESPLSAELFRYIYARYVRELSPYMPARDVDAIERFIADDKRAAVFEQVPAMDYFSAFPLGYVYFGARINQVSWAQQHTLEGLVEQYLR